MKLTLITLLIATNLMAQELPIRYGEKYFSNLNVIYTERKGTLEMENFGDKQKEINHRICFWSP